MRLDFCSIFIVTFIFSSFWGIFPENGLFW